MKKIEVEVSIDTEKAMDQTQNLIKLLRSANSLANELVDTLSRLELNIEV